MTALLLALSMLADAAPRQVPEDVSDAICQGDTVLVATDQFVIRGVCSSRANERVLAVSVRNLASVELGTLRSVALDFCGSPILRTRAPEGWTTTLDYDRGGVRWSRGGADFGEPGISPGSELAGFEIVLQPGWRRSRSSDVLWDASSAFTFTIHDCD